MVQIIIFLIFINKILCESIYKSTTGPGDSNYKAELQFEDDFKTIKSWTVSGSTANINSVGPISTKCYVNKDEEKIECFCDSETCVSPYFILDAIHRWNENIRTGSVEDYELDIEFALEIRKTVIKTIRSVINTFTTDVSAEIDQKTGEITRASRKLYTLTGCSSVSSPSTNSLNLNMANLTTDRFPQFALQVEAISILAIHPPVRTFGELNLDKFLGYLLFEFSGNRDAFWCASYSEEYQECDEAQLKNRFDCVVSAIRATAVGIQTPSYNSIPPSTGPNIVQTWNHSSEFKVEDLFGLGIFLLLFVIPIISLCVFNLIPEKVDHTPLEPTKFAEISKIRELVRQAEQIEDTKTP